MKHLLKVLLISTYLFFCDTLLSTIITVFFSFYQKLNKSPYSTRNFLESILFLSFTRLIFYSVFFLTLFYWFNRKLIIENKLIKLILLNAGLYIIISLLYGFVLMPETKSLFSNELVYIILISTVISPIILYQTSYTRKLIFEVLN